MEHKMCRDEYLAFCKIQSAYTDLRKKKDKMSKQEYINSLDTLINKLDALKEKYDDIYSKEKVNTLFGG